MLTSWSKDHFGSVKQQIVKKKELLWKAEEALARGGDYDEVIRHQRDLYLLLNKEERMWRQRSRIQWVEKGDQNIRFFHGMATQRKRRNFIKGIKDADGVWQTEEEVVCNILVNFYTRLLDRKSVV